VIPTLEVSPVDSLLVVSDLSVGYVTKNGLLRAVNEVSFKVSPGDVTGIVGESGSGKTSLANALLALLRPPAISKGRVSFGERNILSLNDDELRKLRWKELSYIPQGSMNSLNPVMRIKDQFSGILQTHLDQAERDRIRRVMEDSLSKVGLDAHNVLDAYPHELSGGMKQRVIIAMAISLGPKLIVADEPTTALDVVTQKDIMTMLAELKKQMGLTLILISHDISILAEICNYLLVMYAGRVVERGRSEDILNSPKHPYTSGLVASIPRLTGEKRVAGIPGEPPDLVTLPTGCAFHPRCKYRMTACVSQVPSSVSVGDEREVACLLYR
jgi:oligopeptide/dipeptide ABC transporter ATP-binding protein